MDAGQRQCTTSPQALTHMKHTVAPCAHPWGRPAAVIARNECTAQLRRAVCDCAGTPSLNSLPAPCQHPASQASQQHPLLSQGQLVCGAAPSTSPLLCCCCCCRVVLQDGTEKSRQIFITIPTEVGQTEAEEIGEGAAAFCCWLQLQHVWAAGLLLVLWQVLQLHGRAAGLLCCCIATTIQPDQQQPCWGVLCGNLGWAGLGPRV